MRGQIPHLAVLGPTTQWTQKQLSQVSFRTKNLNPVLFLFMDTKKNLYTADASAVGGRSGHVRSATGIIDLEMSVPEGLGGKKGATNPEELFAAGYASCFQQALLVTAQRAGDTLDKESSVQCSVTLFQEGEGYGLSAILDVDLKKFDEAKTIEMVRQAHKICPYSVGTRGNMEVELRVMGKAIPVRAEENAGVAKETH